MNTGNKNKTDREYREILISKGTLSPTRSEVKRYKKLDQNLSIIEIEGKRHIAMTGD